MPDRWAAAPTPPQIQGPVTSLLLFPRLCLGLGDTCPVPLLASWGVGWGGEQAPKPRAGVGAPGHLVPTQLLTGCVSSLGLSFPICKQRKLGYISPHFPGCSS